MAMTDRQKEEAARRLAVEMFRQVTRTANSNLDDLKAAVGAIDSIMDGTTLSLSTAHAGKKVEIAFSDAILAAAPAFTVADRAAAMAMWAMRRANL